MRKHIHTLTHTHILTHAQTHRHKLTHSHTHTHANRQTDRQTDTHTHTQMHTNRHVHTHNPRQANNHPEQRFLFCAFYNSLYQMSSPVTIPIIHPSIFGIVFTAVEEIRHLWPTLLRQCSTHCRSIQNRRSNVCYFMLSRKAVVHLHFFWCSSETKTSMGCGFRNTRAFGDLVKDLQFLSHSLSTNVSSLGSWHV